MEADDQAHSFNTMYFVNTGGWFPCTYGKGHGQKITGVVSPSISMIC